MSDAAPSAPNPSTAQARTIADELARCGVTEVVVCPGSRSGALALAVDAEPRLRCHVHIDERSAGFLALGLGRASGRPAVVVVTSGTAVANLHPAVLEAHHAGVPLIVLAADRPPELRDTGANQTIEQRGLFGSATRWSSELPVAEDRPDAVVLWRATIARAVAAARGLAGAAGPVHIDVAFREPTVPSSDDGRSRAAPFATPLDGRGTHAPWVETSRARRRLDDDAVAALAERAVGVERGLILVGDDALDAHHPLGPAAARRELAAALGALSGATGWPIVAEAVSAVRHAPGVVVAAAHIAAHAPFARAHRPELVVRVGRTGLARAVAALVRDAHQVVVDADGRWIDPDRAMAELVVADPVDLATRWAAALGVAAGSAWTSAWGSADARARAALDAALDAEEGMTEPGLARALARHLADPATLVVASSMPVRDLDLVLAPRPGLEVLANRGVSGIDGTVSTVLGVALARGQEPGAGPVVGLIGDLAFLHDTNGLLVSPDAPSIDATLVVVDNDGGGIFSLLPPAGLPAFERVFGTPHGRDLAALAHAHGAGHRALTRLDDLADALDAARAAGGVRVVHARTDRTDNVAVHRRLADAVAGALDASSA